MNSISGSVGQVRAETYVEANERSNGPAVSADGRYVAFVSISSNLAVGDTNEKSDVFLRDRKLGITELISVNSEGVVGDLESFGPSVSADGRFVAFTSDATNLVPDDTNGEYDVFVRDRERGTTERVSVTSDGQQGEKGSFRAFISADGRYVNFSSWSNLAPEIGDTGGKANVFMHDRETRTTELISVAFDGGPADGDSLGSSPSDDGHFVVFGSFASNLVPDDNNETVDTFVRDRETGTTERVSVASDGTEANGPSFGRAMSADGRFVVFGSFADNLVPDDNNEAIDAFVHDRETRTTERVSVASDGSEGNGHCHILPTISGNGRYVAFGSQATNLVPGDTNEVSDIFVRDREAGETYRISVSSEGGQANGESGLDCIGTGFSFDGSIVAFTSAASNLVPDDRNRVMDCFVFDQASKTTERISVGSERVEGARGAEVPAPYSPSEELPAGYVVVESGEHGKVLCAAPDVTDKRSLLPPSVRRMGPPEGEDIHRLNYNHWVQPEASASITPPDGETGEIRACGQSYLRVPFFQRNSSHFTNNDTYVAWLGDSPFNADKVFHADTFAIGSFEDPLILGAPSEAVSDEPDRVTWKTEIEDNWVSRHIWDEVRFGVPLLFQSRLTVTGTFQFGSKFFMVEGMDMAST